MIIRLQNPTDYLMKVSHSRRIAWRLGLTLRAKVLGTLGAGVYRAAVSRLMLRLKLCQSHHY